MQKIPFSRRRFFKVLGTGSLVVAGAPLAASPENALMQQQKPETNITDAAEVPRNKNSMPGKYPGKVSRVTHSGAIVDNEIVEEKAYMMIEKAMINLTGEKKLKKAWLQFVSPGEKIGLKVNPVAGKTLTTSHAVTRSIIRQLEESGIDRGNIIIWDRRLMQLHETGYTEQNYPGVKVLGTEQQDEEGLYYDSDGKLYGEKMIDKDWYYWADVEGEYDEYTIPFMVNGGKYSYFTRIVTKELDKIINVPILKNAGATVTAAMKNLAFGYTLPTSISQKAGVQKLRIYASIQNVFTITGYSGIDPEIGGGVLMRGVDHQNRYLPSRLVSFGVDLTF